MKRPELKPKKFIKICYEDRNDLRFSIALTYQCYHQTWKQAFTLHPGSPTYVDAHLLNRYKTRVDWDIVIAWAYIDFNDLLLQIEDEEIIMKYNINTDMFL